MKTALAVLLRLVFDLATPQHNSGLVSIALPEKWNCTHTGLIHPAIMQCTAVSAHPALVSIIVPVLRGRGIDGLLLSIKGRPKAASH